MSSIQIQDYTAKSFVVRGDTRDYKEDIKTIGGKWNASLTDKESGERFGGWIFPSGKRREVEKWLCEKDNGHEEKKTQEVRPSLMQQCTISYLDQQEIENMRNMLVALTEVVENSVSPDVMLPITELPFYQKYCLSIVEETSDIEEEDETPHVPKRLLK
tara:strand:+ start:305 stop:781 length:477 start_codon:yes stop_codon:yes gene_type:complete